MRLTLVRHGQTTDNVDDILTGINPGVLTAHGLEQAEQTAQLLKNEKFDAIYSSDLDRAKKTAEVIRKYNPTTPYVITSQLRERDVGELTGRKKAEVPLDRPRTMVSIVHVVPKHGETLEQMQQRARTVLQQVFQQYPTGNILFVSHNGLMRTFFSIIDKKSWQAIVDYEYVENAKPYVVEVDASMF